MSVRAAAGAALLAASALTACASSGAPPSTERLARTYADYLIGRTADLRDDHAAAADRYFAALQYAPDDPALISGALGASMALGDLDGARRAARIAPDEDAPAQAHLVRAADALRGSNWRVANRELERAEGAAADELLARTMQIWASAASGRLDTALMHLQPLRAMRPYGGLFAYQQAMALHLSGRRAEALEAYQIGAEGGMILPTGVIRHAQLLLDEDRRSDALTVLEAASNHSVDPALAGALARVRAGEAAASDALTPAMGAATGVYGMGVIFLQERDANGALVALSLAQLLDPDYEPARILFAQAQSDMGRVDVARSALAQVPASSPYFNGARIIDAWILLDAGHEQAALASMRELSEGGDSRAKRALADMYVQLDRNAEAEPIYSDLIAADDNNWLLHFSRGAAREQLGRWTEAEVDLRQALVLAPEQPQVLNYLGYSWIDRGQNVREGMEMVERALALRPNSGAILDSMGWGYYRLNDFERAVQYLERAVEFEPADPTLNDHLGDAYWRLGRRIEARFQWERALGLSPENASDIRIKLERGLPSLPRSRSARR